MTTEEKLKHFSSVTLENVQKECDEMVAQYKEKMDDYFTERKEESIKKAKLNTSIAEEGIKRKASQEYTSMQMHLRRKINHKQVELKDKLFEEVRKLLADYVKTVEYKESILSKIEKMKKIAGSDEIIVIIDPQDEDIIEDIHEYPTMKIKISDKSFSGGVIGQIPSRNILIDDSYETKFEELKEKYTVGGVI